MWLVLTEKSEKQADTCNEIVFKSSGKDESTGSLNWRKIALKLETRIKKRKSDIEHAFQWFGLVSSSIQ